MSANQFKDLLDRYKEGRLSEGEWERLREMLAEGTYDELLEESIRADLASGQRYPAWQASKEEAIWQKIQARAPELAGQGLPGEEPGSGAAENSRRRRGVVVRWGRWAAAAAAAGVVLALGAHLYFPRQQPLKPVVAVVERPIEPGSNKAYLVLANGQRVVLDNSRKGAVARQGGTQVLKLDSGLLAYQAEASASDEMLYNTVITPRGGQYQLILPDGTKVWLNAASSLRFPVRFAANERKVELTGEGYFEVRHMAAKPFRVKAGQRVIEDIGTAFNINAYDDEPVARTTLIEGAAKVIGKTSVLLHPGEQARWQGEGMERVAGSVDVDEVMAWKNGRISFTDADFASLMRQIGRWYDVNITYEGKQIPQKRFFGILKRNVSLSTILDYLKKNGIQIRQIGREVIILS